MSVRSSAATNKPPHVPLEPSGRSATRPFSHYQTEIERAPIDEQTFDDLTHEAVETVHVQSQIICAQSQVMSGFCAAGFGLATIGLIAVAFPAALPLFAAGKWLSPQKQPVQLSLQKGAGAAVAAKAGGAAIAGKAAVAAAALS
jgi:hypothetical protein